MKPLSQTGLVALLLVIAVLVIFITAAGFIAIKYLYHKQPSITDRQSVKTAGSVSHPKLYQALLEFNPSTGTIVQLKIETVFGLIPVLLLDKPKEDQAEFTYKLIILDQKNIVINSGWMSEPKKYIQTKNKRYRFWVTSEYVPGAVIRLYYPDDKLLWTGFIDEN